MGLFKSDPPAIDYEGAAVAEGEAAKELTNMQTWANRPVQQNPWGTVNWDTQKVIDPATGQDVTQWMQTTQLAEPLNNALWDQMRMQEMRSAIAGGMMGGLANQYFQPVLDDSGNPVLDENGQPQMQYNAPDWSLAGGMMMPNEPRQMTLEDMPDLWGHLQWDIPQYQTTGQVRQLNYGHLPGVNDPTGAYGNLYGPNNWNSQYSQLSGVNDPQWTVNRAEDATYSRMQKRLDDQFNGQRQALEIKMRNQGLAPGDEAWQAQMQSLEQKANDAYQNAQNEAIMAGGREAERMFGMESSRRQQGMGEIESRYGMDTNWRRQREQELQNLFGMQSARRGMFAGELLDLGNFANQAAMNDFQQRMAAGSQGFQDTLAAANFQNQARQQAYQERMGALGYNNQLAYQHADYANQIRQQQINEYLTQRGFTLNEIQALLNNQQVGLPQFNQFNTASKADTPQLLQAAMMQGQQNAANASADNQFMNSLLGGAGMAMGMFSDRRLKSDITKIGVRNGVNWYRYTIGGQPQFGVMADEVPWAAFEHPSGYLMVDYRRV